MRPRTKAAPPFFWQHFAVDVLRASPQLAQELWAHVRSATLIYQTERCMASSDQAALEHFALLVQPKLLFEAAERISPPGRNPRRRDIIRLEETILKLTNIEGCWR